MRLAVPGVRGWADEPLWAQVYDAGVEHPVLGVPAWRLGLNSDLRRLYAATAEIGRQPFGAAVLDVPCGGGVALRGLRAGQGIRFVACDIAAGMLGRATAAARRHGVLDQVETVLADVVDLPFDDGEFDLVVSFTGLHCFPDPRSALQEMGRVTRAGGVITGSALLNDTGLRFLPLRLSGRVSGLLGPGATRAQVRTWLEEAGFGQVEVALSGALGYFRGVRQ